MEPIAREYWWDHVARRERAAIAGTYNPACRMMFTAPLHWHDFLELLFVHEGTAEVVIGQTSFQVQQGDLLCINPNEPHSFRSREGACFGVVQLTLDLLAAGQRDPVRFIHHFTSHRLLPAYIPECVPHAAKWRNCLATIIRETEKDDGFATLHATALALALIGEMAYPDGSAPMASTSPAPDLERLYQLQDFVRQHYAEPLTLQDAADVVHLSRPHLCRVLKRWMGCTFTTYLREIRVTRAHHLLRTSDWPITRIALEVGFTAPTAFDRAFRAVTGMSPRAYRQSATSDHANPG